MRNYQSLVQIDSTTTEIRVAEFVKKTLEAEGIPVTVVSKDSAHPNVIARLKGNGSKRPFLIMGHSDTVKVDPSKWTFPPSVRLAMVGLSMAAAPSTTRATFSLP